MRWVEVCRDHNIHSFISQCAAAVAPLSIGMVTLIMKLRLLPNVPLTRPWLIIEFQETIGGIYLLLQTSSSIHPNNIVIRLRRAWTTHTSKLYGHIPYCEWYVPTMQKLFGLSECGVWRLLVMFKQI